MLINKFKVVKDDPKSIPMKKSDIIKLMNLKFKDIKQVIKQRPDKIKYSILKGLFTFEDYTGEIFVAYDSEINLKYNLRSFFINTVSNMIERDLINNKVYYCVSVDSPEIRLLFYFENQNLSKEFEMVITARMNYECCFPIYKKLFKSFK